MQYWTPGQACLKCSCNCHPTLDLCTRHPLLLGGQRQCGFNACPRLLYMTGAAGIKPWTPRSRVQPFYAWRHAPLLSLHDLLSVGDTIWPQLATKENDLIIYCLLDAISISQPLPIMIMNGLFVFILFSSSNYHDNESTKGPLDLIFSTLNVSE